MNAIKDDGHGPYYVQSPNASLPVSVDWSRWLREAGTTIAASAWTVEEPGVTLSAASLSTTRTTVFVQSGAACIAKIRNTITTASGLVDSRTLRVVVRDR